MIFLYLVFFQMLGVNNQCDKETPIRKKIDNNCYNTYCTENEFQNGDCIIDNPIIKTQWLNKLFYLGDNIINILTVIEMPNNNIFFLSSSWDTDSDDFYIYRLESSGEINYNENNNNFKKILMSSFTENGQKLLINAVGLIIDNKEYIFVCQFFSTECQLIEFENNIIFNKRLFQILGVDEFMGGGFYYTILNLNQNNNILLSFVYMDYEYNSFLSLSKINLKKDEETDFCQLGGQSILGHAFNSFLDISCFITERNFLECLVQYDNELKVEIYNEIYNELNHLYSIDIDSLGSKTISFAKCIHLKNEIGVFSYYFSPVGGIGGPLYIQIKELRDNNLENVIDNNDKFEIAIEDNYSDLISSLSFNIFLIKLSDNKFSIAYLSDNAIYEKGIIIIVIFDLYGDNEDNLFIRYYKININLYNLIMCNWLNLNLFKFNSFLGIAFVGVKADDITSDNKGIFAIFGYSSKKQITHIDLDLYKNNQGFILELNNYFSIENNLFGYDLDIKISSISNELKGIRFYSLNENKEININDIINVNDKIIFEILGTDIQIGENYFIEITSNILTPEYDKISQFYVKNDKYGEKDFKQYYKRKIIDTKIFKINIHISSHDQSKRTCKYPELTTKIIDNNSIDIIYFSNFVYIGETNNLLNTYLRILSIYNSNDEYCNNNIINNYEYIYMNECVNKCPSCYIPDSSNNCILNCGNENQYMFNSEYYDKCPEGTKEDIQNGKKFCKCENLFYKDENLNNICLSSLICDDNHPILNEETNECLNYNVKYGNNYHLNCPENTCISQRYYDLKICEEKIQDMKIFNGICFNDYSKIIDKLEELVKNNIKINDNEGITISAYSYNNDYKNNFDKLLQDNSKLTIIDLRDYLEEYKRKNKIDDKTDIYIVIIDTPRKYSNETTNRFNFELYFDNLTKINIDNDNINMKVYSPITNEKLINFELANYFNEQDYNIFNKNDKFYKDICSPANIDDNDITLNDRYIDIYPHDIQICPEDCENIGTNLTSKTFICDCKIKEDEDYEYELMNSSQIWNYFKDFNNLVEYFSDMFNYKIIKCYQLLFDLKNYKNNIGFYIGISFFISSLGLLIFFRILGFKTIRIHFYHNYNNLINEINYKNSKNNEEEKEKHKTQKNNEKLKANNEICDTNNNTNKSIYLETNVNLNKSKKKSLRSKQINNFTDRKNTINKNKDDIKDKNSNNITEESNKTIDSSELNTLSYFIAINEDNRNFFKMYFSIFISKIDLIQIIFFPEDYSNRLLLFNIYIIDLYIDLLMNSILYNDYAVSQKYHNNGTLEFVTSLIISLFSNILTSFVMFFINYLVNYHEFIDSIIKEIKRINIYFNIIVKLFKIITIKYIFLFVVEILIGLFMVYYLFIFGVITSKSINSFLLNYLLSQLDSLVYSLAISLIISLIRKISLLYRYKRLYVISLYFNEHL